MTAHQEGHQVLRALSSPARDALLLWKVRRKHVGHKVRRQLLLLMLTHGHLRRKLPGRSMLGTKSWTLSAEAPAKPAAHTRLHAEQLRLVRGSQVEVVLKTQIGHRVERVEGKRVLRSRAAKLRATAEAT